MKGLDQTLVVIKPDGVQRSLVGRILQRFEDAGLKIVAMKMAWVDEDFAADHYFDVAKRHGEIIFKANVDFITLGPVVAMVIEGVGAIGIVRKIVGSTYPDSALPGTIRGDFSHHNKEWTDKDKRAVRNLIHASSSKSDAKTEIALWFKPAEIHTYKTVHEQHTF